MFSTIKSAFTTTPTPATIDPSKFNGLTEIPVAESRYKAIETWNKDDKGEYGLATLKSMLNRVGLDMITFGEKFVNPASGFANVVTKDRKRILLLKGIDNRDKGGNVKLWIRPNFDEDLSTSTFNDAVNVVKFWASGKSGGKKRRSKTYKKKRVSRKTRRHSR